MVLLHIFDRSRTRSADFGYIPEGKSKNPRGLNEISLPLARMVFTIFCFSFLQIFLPIRSLCLPCSYKAKLTATTQIQDSTSGQKSEVWNISTSGELGLYLVILSLTF